MKVSDGHRIDVSVIMGSKSDAEVMATCENYLQYFGISYEVKVLSAHRNPEELRQYLVGLGGRGVQAIIAAAGMAAHLPGAIAAQVAVPVIGVPLSASSLGGLDALLSIVQMPAGIPVATVSIGRAGAANAAVLAAEILALKNPEISEKLADFRKQGSRLP